MCKTLYGGSINDKAVSIFEKLSAVFYNRKAKKIILNQYEKPWQNVTVDLEKNVKFCD